MTGTVGFEWALLGKEPGQREDYQILCAGGARLRPATLERIIQHFSPGSPAGERAGEPDALPWITFTAATSGETPYVGVAIREWPADPAMAVDATGRVVIPTRFFCLPLDDFRRHLGSFTALYEAVRVATVSQLRRLPEVTGGQALSLRPAASPPRRAGALASPALRFLRGAVVTAALALDGPVVVRAVPELATHSARIAFLDLVAALLPAGAEGALAAGTWVDVATSHRLRVAFGQDLGGTGRLVDPTAPPRFGPPNPNDEWAPRYASLLAYLIDGNRPADHGAGHGLGHDAGHDNGIGRDNGLGHDHSHGDGEAGLRTVLGWLAEDITPRSFSRPGEIFQALTETAALDLATRFAAGRAGPEHLRRHLAALPAPADPTGVLLPLLLPFARPEDLTLVARHWAPALAPAVVDLVVRLCAAGGREYRDLASHLQGAPEAMFAAIVGGLLEPGADDDPPPLDAVELAADIIREHGGATGDRATWAPVRNGLAASPARTLQVLVRYFASRGVPGLLQLVEWLAAAGQPQTDAVLRPFRVLGGNSGNSQESVGHPDLTAVGAADGIGEAAMLTVVRLAGWSGRAEALTPALEEWLWAEADRAPFSVARRRTWTAALDELWPDRRADERQRLGRLIGEPKARRRLLRRNTEPTDGEAVPDDPSSRLAAGTRVQLGAGWVDPAPSPQPASADGRGIWELARLYTPGVRRDGPPGGTSDGLVLFGDGGGRLAVCGADWCCHTGLARFVDSGVGITGLSLAAAASAAAGSRPSRLQLVAADQRLGALDVDAFGFGAVAAVAAGLLDGPVSVVGAPPALTTEQRLRFIEAVLALLPAGLLAGVAVTTATDNPTPFRLAFTTQGQISGGRSRLLVPWGDLPEAAEPPSSYGREYFRRLLSARALFQDTAGLVHALSAWRDPLDVDQAEDLLDVLTDTNPAFVSPLPASKSLEKARSRRRAAMAGRFAREPEEADALRILLSGGTMADLQDAVVFANRLETFQRLDGILARLIRGDGRDTDRVARTHAGALLLLQLSGGGEAVRAALQELPEAAVSWIIHLTRSGSFAALNAAQGGWLRWLTPPSGQLPPALAVFQALVTPRPAPIDLRLLAVHGDDALLAALQIARYGERHGPPGRFAQLLRALHHTRPALVDSFLRSGAAGSSAAVAGPPR
ncbi:hypothetical protein [Frankia sp. CcI49]|uniref:hypothetical protein n=1 Tax=Frankia sp. CcI49 TaxID=1745382 RepID=UPI001F52316B|nr:hypothetical protein [Frankia sp. CcI49]